MELDVIYLESFRGRSAPNGLASERKGQLDAGPQASLRRCSVGSSGWPWMCWATADY